MERERERAREMERERERKRESERQRERESGEPVKAWEDQEMKKLDGDGVRMSLGVFFVPVARFALYPLLGLCAPKNFLVLWCTITK